MCALQFMQFVLMAYSDVEHLLVFQLFTQLLCLPFEPFCLDVHPFRLAILLEGDRLLSVLAEHYISSCNLSESIEFCSVFTLPVPSVFLAILGEGRNFLAVVGLLN